MSRLTEWQDEERTERDDYSTVIDDDSVQVDVYRVGASGSAPGFGDEIADYAFFRRLVAKIDEASINSHNKVSGEAGKGIVYDLVASTFDTDVRMTDRWLLDGKFYRVVSVDDITEKRVEVKLKYLKDEELNG